MKFIKVSTHSLSLELSLRNSNNSLIASLLVEKKKTGEFFAAKIVSQNEPQSNQKIKALKRSFNVSKIGDRPQSLKHLC